VLRSKALKGPKGWSIALKRLNATLKSEDAKLRNLIGKDVSEDAGRKTRRAQSMAQVPSHSPWKRARASSGTRASRRRA